MFILLFLGSLQSIYGFSFMCVLHISRLVNMYWAALELYASSGVYRNAVLLGAEFGSCHSVLLAVQLSGLSAEGVTVTRFWRVVVRCIQPCGSRRSPLGRVLKVLTCFLFSFLSSSVSEFFSSIVGRGLRVSRGRAIRKRPW